MGKAPVSLARLYLVLVTPLLAMPNHMSDLDQESVLADTIRGSDSILLLTREHLGKEELLHACAPTRERKTPDFLRHYPYSGPSLLFNCCN